MAAVEFGRTATAMLATSCEKPTFLTSHWLNSTHEAGGSRGLDGTSGQEAVQGGSTLLGAQEVLRREGLLGQRTTPSEARVELLQLDDLTEQSKRRKGVGVEVI